MKIRELKTLIQEAIVKTLREEYVGGKSLLKEGSISTDSQLLDKFAQKLARLISGSGVAGWKAAQEMMLDREFAGGFSLNDLGALESMAVALGASPRRTREACQNINDLLVDDEGTLDESLHHKEQLTSKRGTSMKKKKSMKE